MLNVFAPLLKLLGIRCGPSSVLEGYHFLRKCPISLRAFTLFMPLDAHGGT